MPGFDINPVEAQLGQAQQQQNPVQLIEGLAFARNAMNQNRMFQANIAANQGLTQAIGPDGRVNPAALNAFLQTNPNALPAAGEALSTAYGLQGQQLTNQNTALTGASQRFSNLENVVASYGAQNPSDPVAQRRDVMSGIALAAQAGIVDPSTANYLAANGQTPDGLTLDQLIKGSVLSQPAGSAVNKAMIGENSTVTTGPDVRTINTRTNIGGQTTVTPATGPAASIPLGLAPAQVNTPAYPYYDPTSQSYVTVTQGQAAAARAADQPLPGADATGRINAGPPLGAEAGANAANIGGVNQYLSDQQWAGGANGRIFVLKKALSGLENSNTGPGTAETNNIASFLNSQVPFGLGKLLPGVDPSTIQNYDEANKYLTQYAAASASAYGPGTDAKLATALTGNASTHISSLAAQDVVKASIGVERMGEAAVADFARTGQPWAQYPAYRAQWALAHDPRAYELDLLSAQQRAKLIGSLSPTERSQLAAGVRSAVQSGVYGLNDIGGQ